MHCLLYHACDEAVPVHHWKLLYNNYEPRKKNVKCLMRVTQDRVHMLPPSMLLPFYHDIPVGARRLQRTRTEKAPLLGLGAALPRVLRYRSVRRTLSLRNCPVSESGLQAICSGVPVATMRPPLSPPSGPRSMAQSAFLMTSRLCSMTMTVLPLLVSSWRTPTSFSTSAKCRPVVGSSRIYSVLPAVRLPSSAASLIRWASPPDRVTALCPRRIYPSPTASSSFSMCFRRACASKTVSYTHLTL